MNKWYGKVGYVIDKEVKPGVWVAEATERTYFGDLLSGMSKWSPAGKVNDDLNISSKISIMADPFANKNFSSIKYVEFMGTLWDVTGIEPQFPRLILQVGGVYNGQTPDITE